MGIVLDLLIVAIIALCIVFAAKRGFVRTLIELAGFVAAVLLAVSLSVPVSNFVYEKAAQPAIEKTIASAAKDAISESGSAVADNIWNALPGFIANSAEKAGITKSGIEAQLTAAGSDTEAMASAVTDKLLKPVVLTIIKFIVSIVLFAVLLIVVKLLARIVNAMFKGALLGTANTVLGGALGAVKGLIYSVLFCLIVSLIAHISKNGILFITSDAVEASVLCKYILNILPFSF